MRWFTIIAAASATIAAAIRAQAHEPGDGCAHARAAMMQLGGGLAENGDAGGIAGAGDDSDVTHYHLDIAIDPVAETISGSNTMSVTSLVNGLSQFRVRLRSNFNISAVEVSGLPVSWTRVDTVLIEVTLDRVYNSGESFDVYIAYSGVPVSRGFGSIEFREHGPNDTPLVFTLSETWFAYTWWPVKDSGDNNNSDKATADLWFTVPETMSVASNGSLLAIDPLLADDGLHRFEWATAYATSEYLFSFSTTNYDRFSSTFNHPGGTMPLEFFIYPESNSAANRNAWLKTVDMLGVFSNVFGEYPFINEKYGIYQFAFGGGMEHQTMTGQGTFSESVTAHELGHQWWGDMTTCERWNDIWLNEGFATYSEALWEEFKPGSSGAAALHAHMASRRPTSVDGSVYVYDATNFNRIFSGNFSYRKGGWVLHMLRRVVGDDAFFDILAAYRDAFEYTTATTDDFIAVAEQVVGRDLNWFFDKWVYDIGAPEYEFGWRPIAVAGQDYLELFVRQVQDIDFPLFAMPIDVVATVGGAPFTHVVQNDAPAQHFLLPTTGAVSALAFDPQKWILWTDATAVSFVEGPPKIVAATPVPGAAVSPADALALTIVFHKNVNANSGAFTLVGDTVGTVPLIAAYDAPSRTATLQPASVLAPDAYTLTVAAGITGIAGGLALDGEMSAQPAPFPSGNGLAGGDAVWRFSVIAVDLPGDMNCDGLVDFFDVDGFLLAQFAPQDYETQYPACDMTHADANEDGSIDFFDIDPFVALLFD